MQNATNKGSSIKLFVIAMIVGVIAAALAYFYLKAKEAQLIAELTPKIEKRMVIVANKRMLKGTKLTINDLAQKPVPVEFLNAESLQPGDLNAILDKTLVQNVNAGNVILASYVELGFPKDFSDTIKLKRRAMTIQVDEINTISGFIRPGNKIDLFVNLPADSGVSDVDSVMPVLENVEVLATGESSAFEYEEKVRLLRGGYNAKIDRNYTTLTINVTPREAAILATAQDKGDLLALLRNRNDQSGSRFDKVVSNDLVQNASKLAENSNIREAAAAAQGFVVGEDGIIRNKDGVALKNQDLIVTADGTIMTKDGVVLSGRGLTVNENGELVDANGNIVDPNTIKVAADGSLITADGTVLDGPRGIALGKGDLKVSGDGVVVNGQLLEGVTQRADGKLVLADGTVVDPDDVVVGADGVVRLKDGTVLNGVKSAGVMVNGQVLEGVTKRADGKLVLADGTVVDPDDVVVGADGVVRLKDGTVLEGVSAGGVMVDGQILEGVAKRADGKLVLADGTVVDPDDVVIGEDGVVRLKDGTVLEGVNVKPKTLETDDGTVITGLNINKDGKVVLADGTVVDPSDLVVTSDGRVFTKDGKEVTGATVGVGIKGLKQNADGSITTASGAIIKGATLNEDGKLVLADGTIVDPDDVIIRPDGTIVTKSGKVLEGLSADTSAVANLAGGITFSVDYIVGGVSTDGVADVKKVPVEENKQ